MSARRWILGNDRRICPRACAGYSKPTCTTTVANVATGIYHKKCRECGAEETGQLNSFKELRPCKRCKDVRDVTVRLWSGREGDPIVEHFKETCTTCDMELSAAHHYRTAKDFFQRAEKLRAAQKKKLLRGKAAKVELVDVKPRSVKELVARDIAAGAAPAIATGATIRELVAAEEGKIEG